MQYKKIIFVSFACSSLSANAAVFTSTGSPFDVTLDNGNYNWANNTATVTSTDTTSTGTQQFNTSVTTDPMVEVIDPQVGIPGSVEVYTETTATEYDRDFTSQSQQISVSVSDSITGQLQTPSSLQLAGSIQKQAGATQLLGNDSLYFNMGLSVGFDDNSDANNANGTLSFLVGNIVGDWTYTFTVDFDSITDSFSLAESQYLNFEEDIYFLATYDIAGANGIPFNLTNVFLSITAGDTLTTYDPRYNEVIEVTRNTLSFTEIPALQPSSEVPLPAAAWLFGSALTGLIGLSRKR